ncbi:TetR/AcrR family transcriptional regulator [Pseudomonas bijieensis]|jgi:AcrR family transcriptional regulator|uniref:TetR/AcrR family transcriptional regulator n=1 Tax=Pseudomonas bijieensis TaxID=2681983 RepID=UPI00200FB530|nr:TetR/AcrR family transcriptional regulator [Pseudomonas bijieensis]UQI33834.1 TetR/AcrR family transcriptional regulator [Pseudomonas bijieensis]
MPETTAQPAKRGRPPLRSREEQMRLLLDAAAQALGSGNFANVTMDAIARAAGISKKTVYLLVASKEALLSQLVARDLSTLELLLESGIDCAEDLLSELRMYLTLWARLTLSPLALGLYLMAAQGRETAPGIARIWYQEGAERCLGLLRGWLGKAAGKGLLANEDVEAAIELIDALLISQPLKLFTLGVQQSWSDEQIEQRVEVALGMFSRCFIQHAPCGEGINPLATMISFP